MMHFVSKKESFTNPFKTQRGVNLLGFCILLLNDQAYSFCNGMGRVRKAGLYGYVGDTPDRKNWIPCEYEEAFDFDTVHPYAVVKVQGKYGVIDKGGNYKVEPVFDTYHRTHQRIGQEYYNATIGDKYYLLSANGTYKEVK